MTDLVAALYRHGPQVPLVASKRVKVDDASDGVAGFDGLARAYVGVRASNPAGSEPAMSVTIEQSADGEIWEAATVISGGEPVVSFDFTETGLQFAMIVLPKDQLRASWEITGTVPRFTLRVSVTPGGYAELPSTSEASEGDALTVDGSGGVEWTTLP